MRALTRTTHRFVKLQSALEKITSLRQPSIISLLFIRIGSGSIDLISVKARIRAACMHYALKCTASACGRNDEWKAIPPTRHAIENRAGSGISIITSGYYIYRTPLFSRVARVPTSAFSRYRNFMSTIQEKKRERERFIN